VHSTTDTYIHAPWTVWVVYSSAEQGLSSQVLDHLKHTNGIQQLNQQMHFIFSYVH
jgi:hypothetical protein